MFKYVAVVAGAVTLAVSGAVGLVRSGPADAPRSPTPVAADLALEGQADLTGVITGLQQQLERLPDDYDGWAQLGLAYVEQARVSGNPIFYDKAEEAVDRSFDVQPGGNARGLAARAALAAAQHDFEEALHQAEQALRINPRETVALLIRVDSLTELGRYEDQLLALRQADRRQPGIPVVARYSYAYELRGRTDDALDVLLRWAGTGSRADRAYLLTLAADLERRAGELSSAGRHLRLALQNSPGYVPALVSQARLAVARGELETAVRRWRLVVVRLPLAEYVSELGELELELGRDEAARTQFSVVESTIELLEGSGVNADLETALFDADHGDPRRALIEARQEWRRRHSIHVADALAWALHANGRHGAALRMSEQATRLGTREPRFWLHRGAIEAALGRTAAAEQHLRLGLSLDPGLSPWQAARARDLLDRLEDR